MPYVEWTPDMGEISGFGGSYEAGCRAMVKAGVEFWEAQDAAHARGEREKFDPHYQGFEGVFGLLTDDNADAKALDRAMMDTPFVDDRTGETTRGDSGLRHLRPRSRKHRRRLHCGRARDGRAEEGRGALAVLPPSLLHGPSQRHDVGRVGTA